MPQHPTVPLRISASEGYIPAVDDDGGGDVMGVVADLVEEVESWLCGGWHSVVGPGREPEVGDVARHKPLRKGEKEDICFTVYDEKWTDG